MLILFPSTYALGTFDTTLSFGGFSIVYVLQYYPHICYDFIEIVLKITSVQLSYTFVIYFLFILQMIC